MYDQLKKIYSSGKYDQYSALYKYMNYMNLYMHHYKTHYANYYTRHYHGQDMGYYMTLLSMNDLKPYPKKERYYSEEEKYKMENTYKKHGIAVPIMAVAKKGKNSNMYYYILDGYYMYMAMKNAGEKYVPAIVYYGISEDMENSYMANPYFGYNYKMMGMNPMTSMNMKNMK